MFLHWTVSRFVQVTASDRHEDVEGQILPGERINATEG